MENESKRSVHTELEEQAKYDPALRVFNAKKQLEAQLLTPSGNELEPEQEDSPSVPGQASVTHPAIVHAQEPADNSITVKIKPKNTTIELTFKSEEPKGSFAVKLPTVDVTVTDDSITTIILPEVEIIPPTLVPLTVKIKGVSYSVIYAGATCTLNKLRFISFVRVQEG